MNDFPKIHFSSRTEFRNWLNKNYTVSNGIWMIFYKKLTDKKNILYDEALEEALCFGWIDSTIKKIDDEKYLRKFTPRTDIKNWSDLNKKRVLMLIENGRMTKAGLEKIDVYLKTGKVEWEVSEKRKELSPILITPDFIIDELAKNEPALTNFNKLAPSHRRNYILWITQAKKEETIKKRLEESIKLLLKNEKLGMK